MTYNIIWYVSLAIFIIGLIYRVSTWFRYKIGIDAKEITTSKRFYSVLKGLSLTIFSVKVLCLTKVFFLDVILQKRILKEDFIRWIGHMLISYGFMLLMLMHAFDKVITVSLFREYYSTLNPFLFLRDLFGAMVVIGLGIAIWRRFIRKVPRLKTNAMDQYAIVILSVIMVSGIFLEGLKITSYSAFASMEEDYSGLEDEEEILALESYWVQEYGLVSPHVKSPFNEDVLARGQELNADNCIDCHSRPQWAFTGYAVSKIINPIAVALDQIGGVTLLWYIHFIACFMGLACLPFSKMFHVIATPISLMANTAMVQEESNSSNISTRQLMELDACTHCGTCNIRCSVIMAFEALGNEYILPSEKMVFLKSFAAGKDLSPKELKAIQEGIYLCTNCDRCTVVCPSGINLKELWISIRENLLQTGYPEPLVLSPFSFVRGLMRGDLDQNSYFKPIILIRDAITDEHKQKVQNKVITISQTDRDFKDEVILSDNASTFSACFNCKTCTSVCPVVANYDNPAVVLGLLPHQIMHSLGLGLKVLVLDSKMPWDCLTCYLCQENCPKGVSITEVFYELKNLAIKHRIE